MAVRTITSDIVNTYVGANGYGELTDCDATTNFSEPSGTGGTSGDTYSDIKSFAVDTEFKLEGTGALGAAWTTNSPERGGLLYNYNSATVVTDGAILVWMWFIAPSALASYSVGGLWVGTGSALSAFNVYRVSGNDFNPAPKGGWYCFAVDPSQTAERYEQVGSPSATINYIGGGLACTTQMSRGLTHFGIDAIRIGRCKLTVRGGTSTDTDADFSYFATGSEALGSGKLGIFELESGAFYMQGMIQIGDDTLSNGNCDFTDSNKTINIRNTPAVGPNFHRIEILNSSTNVASNVSWTSCTFVNLGVGDPVAATASRGDFEVMDDTANVDFITCSFTDMGTFILGSVTTITDTTFRRCETITQNSATITGCTIDSSFSSTALIVDDISTVTGCNFVSDGTGHAVQLSTTISADTSIDWSHTLDDGAGTEWTGSTGTTVGVSGTANDAILVNVSSGFTLTINVASGATIPTVRNTGAGSVTISAGVTTSLTVIDIDGAAVNAASVALFAKDGTGDLPYQDAVTISNASTTATVTHTGHNLETGDKVLIEGGTEPLNRGVFTVTVTNSTTYTYTMSSAPSGSPTGCTATWAAIFEVLGAGANVATKVRAYTADQPVVGWARKSTTSPYYKNAPVTGTIDVADGLSLTALLLTDE